MKRANGAQRLAELLAELLWRVPFETLRCISYLGRDTLERAVIMLAFVAKSGAPFPSPLGKGPG